MIVLALDIGEKRCGIAVSDAAGKIALPLKVLPTTEVVANAPVFRRIVEDYEPELLLVGLPLSLDGMESQQTAYSKKAAGCISKNLGLPLEFQDERLSSTEAKTHLRAQGYTEKEMRGRIDMIAASVFLQTYLDANAR
ncbi:MAG TPA: Holliday junction resolvase RuvX [Coriobacteriia bacterium]|nr:Holliday junction resolvase RuvX [Coriobacteriia bacterium]